MTKLRYLLPSLLVTVVSGCYGASGAPYDAHVGFVFHRAKKTYLYTTAPHISKLEYVYVEYPDVNGVTRCCRRLQGSLLGTPTPEADTVVDVLGSQPVFRYLIPSTGSFVYAMPFVGIAVIGEKAKEVPDTKGMRLDISSIPPAVAFSCLSTEGMHLFVKVKTREVAHLYYGFDYDVKPTCSSKLF